MSWYMIVLSEQAKRNGFNIRYFDLELDKSEFLNRFFGE